MLTPTIFYRRGIAHARLFIGKSPLRQLYPNQRFLVRVLGPMDDGTARLYGAAWALSELIKAKAMSDEIRLSGLIIKAGGIVLDTTRPDDLRDLEQLGYKDRFFKAVDKKLEREMASPIKATEPVEVITLGQVVDTYLQQKLPSIKNQRQVEMLEFVFRELLPSFASKELKTSIIKVNHLGLKDSIMHHLCMLPANVKNNALFRSYFQGKLQLGMEGVWLAISAGKIKEYKQLGPRTIDKYVETFQAFWNFAEKAFRDMPKSPFFLVKSQVNRQTMREGKVLKKRSFSDEELRLIFSGLKFDRSWKKWIVLVAMYTGARVNEIAQLQITDVAEEAPGVYSITFSDEGEGQRVKTDSSRRKLPVHQGLMDLGFIDYWQSKVGQKIKPLFPDLKPNPNYPAGKPVSHWFNRAIRVIGLTEREITFHSFRHTVATRLAHAGVALRDISDITGHTLDGADKSVLSRHYIDTKEVLALRVILNQGLIYPESVLKELA